MKTTLIFAALLLAFTGCENTVDNPEWPEYSEQLVVVGSVRFTQDDSALVECTVRRTLPLWEEYSLEKALWPTAKVQLDDGEQIHDVPLVSTGNARFSKKVLGSGSNRYTLLVSEGTKHARATLEVESLPTVFSTIRIDTLSVHDDGFIRFRFRGAVHTNPSHNASFSVRYQVKEPPETEWRTLGNYSYIPGQPWWQYWWTKVTGDTLVFEHSFEGPPSKVPWLSRLILDAYSGEYTEYELAKNSYYGGDDFFGSPQKNPPFNVTGDGIGFVWYIIEGPPLELKFSM